MTGTVIRRSRVALPYADMQPAAILNGAGLGTQVVGIHAVSATGQRIVLFVTKDIEYAF